jgi:hypothetical protein
MNIIFWYLKADRNDGPFVNACYGRMPQLKDEKSRKFINIRPKAFRISMKYF